MTLTTPYSATFIVGDGETKTFSYLFEEVSPNFISVMVYNSVTGLISTPTYVIDTDQKQVIFGEDTPAPTADETVCIYRNTPNVQDVAFRTLHGYDAQTLENILSKIVAMIQEIKSNYFSTQVLQGDPWQLDLLSSEDDGATVNIDYTAKKLVKGLYFRITSGNLQVSADGATYLTLPKSDDVAEFRQYEQTLPDLTVIRKLQYRVGNQWFDAEANAQYTADEAYTLAESVQTTMSAHINNTQNPHQTSMANLTDTDLSDAESGQFLQFDGVKWKAVYSTASVSWGGILGNLDDQADLKTALDGKVEKAGDTMTGALNIANIASSNTALLTLTHSNTTTYKWNIAPRYNSTTLSVYPGSTETNGFRFATTGFVPASNNARYLGSASLKWKGIYTGALNNGADLVVPNKAGTLATMDDVELAARSGTQLTDQGVWYAKMYAATVVPSAENGTNYADFSQTDAKGNPIIVTYNRVNGAWVQDQTITPPAEYDGYVIVTSKIWDIAEQTGQQGGRILWNHQSKEFTPYPQIISFKDIGITGDSTVDMPQNPGANQIVNKDYVDEAIASIPTPTVDVTQSIDAEIVGSLTITDNSIVSGFSENDYLKFPGVFKLGDAESFEIAGSFISANPNSVVLRGCEPGSTQTQGVYISVAKVGDDSFLRVTVYHSTALGDYQTIDGITALQTNTEYYFKFGYNLADNLYKIWLSTDGETYTLERSVSVTKLPGESVFINGSNYPITSVNMSDWAIAKNGQMIWAGMDAPGLQQRVMKGHEVIEFQAPTSTNNYTWYRKYADGWVEQGGYVDTTNATYTATFPVEMADTNYTIQVSSRADRYVIVSPNAALTTTGVTGWIADSRNGRVYWEVKGMAQG